MHDIKNETMSFNKPSIQAKESPHTYQNFQNGIARHEFVTQTSQLQKGC